jgi:hypothetical protein
LVPKVPAGAEIFSPAAVERRVCYANCLPNVHAPKWRTLNQLSVGAAWAGRRSSARRLRFELGAKSVQQAQSLHDLVSGEDGHGGESQLVAQGFSFRQPLTAGLGDADEVRPSVARRGAAFHQTLAFQLIKRAHQGGRLYPDPKRQRVLAEPCGVL